MKRFLHTLLVAATLLSTGCSLDLKLDNQFSDPDAITSAETARKLLASAYNSLPRFQLEFSILSDDFYPTSLAQKAVGMLNLYQWSEKAIDELSRSVWTEYYLTIAYVNALLPRMDKIVPQNDAEASELAKIRSEAKALKAMCYFDLLRLYAPAWSAANAQKDGIILKDRLELDFLPRSTLANCIEEIAALLSQAADTENSQTKVFYLSTPAIRALQAEVELYRKDYKAAIGFGLPLLADLETRWTAKAYNNLWSSNDSDERLFAPYIFNSFYTELCYTTRDGDYFILNDAVAYTPGDVRTPWSVYPVQIPAGEVRSLGKYNRMYYEKTTVRYINTLRYAGTCLTVAEAYARDGQPGQAVMLMNRYLRARGAASLDEGLSGDALIEAICDERQKEFVGEGVRLFDLKRLHKSRLKRYRTLGNGVETTIAADDYRWLFPIPKSEYKYNDQVTQNPGWPKLVVN